MNMAVPKPATHDAYCQGMRRLASGVTVIASSHEGERAGLTATAVCSVTADPPRLLVCVNRGVYAHDVIVRSGKLSVNVLSTDQEEIAKRFAGMVKGVSGADRFSDDEWGQTPAGMPYVRNAPVAFECSVTEAGEMGTHSMFLCDVTDVVLGQNSGDPLVYFDGCFASVSKR